MAFIDVVLFPGIADDEQGDSMALKNADSNEVFKVMALSLLPDKRSVDNCLITALFLCSIDCFSYYVLLGCLATVFGYLCICRGAIIKRL